MTVPYIFATQTGSIPLAELDANFAAVSNNVLTANTVTNNAQPNITSVGVLNSLSVSGNIVAGNVLAGAFYGDGSHLTNLPSANYANANVANYLPVYGGNIQVLNITNAGGNAVGNIGNSTSYFNTAYIRSTSAEYADVAEMYAADQAYNPGTVLEIGGPNEVRASTKAVSTAIAGVVSTNPSYTMNSKINAEFPVEVALLGRVPTRVIGTIQKGQILVSSDIPGVATAGLEIEHGSIIGKALQDYNSQEEGIIEVLVGRI